MRHRWFRPTTFLYPSTGTAPISALFDQVGPHARHVADLALFHSLLTRDFEPIHPQSLQGVKLGVVRDYWFDGLDSEVERVTNLALQKLQDAGVVLVESEMTGLTDLIQRITGVVQLHDMLIELPQYLHDSGAGVTFDQVVEQASPELRSFFEDYGPRGSGFVSEELYQAARDIHLPDCGKNSAIISEVRASKRSSSPPP